MIVVSYAWQGLSGATRTQGGGLNMDYRFMTFGAIAVTLAACSESQNNTPGTGADQAMSDAEPDGWTVPRTDWGDPDLQGMWPLDSVGGTPMQRAAELGEKAYLTDAEYDAALEAAAVSAGLYQEETESGRIGSGHWFEWGRPLRQTSLIMEPANGRVPPMTDAGLARAANMKSSWSENIFEDLSDFNALDRCITRGLPASMIPFPYNNGVEIFQSPGYVALRLELVHETRIIPLDGRPAPPAQIQQWLGESRGRWDGDTLVIETTNFNGLSPMVIVGPSNEPVPTSTSLRLTERLTRTGPNTIQYEARVEDPEVLTEAFLLSFPWTRNNDYEIFEYACHEDNTVVPNYIRATSPRFVGEENAGSNFDINEWLRISVERFAEDE